MRTLLALRPAPLTVKVRPRDGFDWTTFWFAGGETPGTVISKFS